MNYADRSTLAEAERQLRVIAAKLRPLAPALALRVDANARDVQFRIQELEVRS
jgi:hypothetical protein